MARRSARTWTMVLQRRNFSDEGIKSADAYFLPNLYRKQESNETQSVSANESDIYERDIELLDNELESLFGPLQEKFDPNENESMQEKSNMKGYNATPFQPNNSSKRAPMKQVFQDHVVPKQRQAEISIPSPKMMKNVDDYQENVHIVNGPCALVRGCLPGTNIPWQQIQSSLEQIARDSNLQVNFNNSNNEGDALDILLNSSATTTVLLNCGDMLHAYPGIQRAIDLSPSQVILINSKQEATPLPSTVKQVTGFGAFGYELALRAVLHQTE